MVTHLSNYALLEGWLGYLQEKVPTLVGDTKDRILVCAKEQNLLQREQYFCLECPLQGPNGMDFALQYGTEDFLELNTFSASRDSHFNRFFQLYGQIVGPGKHFFLELDTATGSGNQAAVFLNVDKQTAEAVVKRMLSWQAEARRLPAVLEVLRGGTALGLLPSYVGFMYSRLNAPLRLSFGITEEVLRLPDRYDNLAFFVQDLEFSKESATLRKMLEKGHKQVRELMSNNLLMKDLILLSQFDFLDCFLDIDIMPDGNAGSVFGVELMPCAHSVEQQQKMLHSREFHGFLKQLQEWDVVDERIKTFADCVFYSPLPQVLGRQEYLFSLISHFKLRYKHNKRLPAKVYLQGNRG